MVIRRETHGSPGVHAAKHVCCVFADDECFTAAAVEFLRQGLAAGDRLLYVADEPQPSDLSGLGDVVGFVDQGVVVLASVRDAYAAGEAADPTTQVAAYRRMTEQALADGYTGLSVAADATRLVTGDRERHDFMAYELAVDRYMAEAPMRAMCAYDERVLADAVLDLVCVHRHQEVPAGMQPGFTVCPDEEGIAVAGEIDVSNAARFGLALDAALAAAEAGAGGELRIDAADLDFIDAEGTSALVSFVEQAAPRHSVVVADPPRSLRAVVETLGWTDRVVLSRREGAG